MMQISKLAGYALAGLALSACGGGTQPTQTQRDALRKPLLETDYAIIDRRSSIKSNESGNS
ncbi:MAG: hypothetical protein HON25_04715, partial [Gammaproteobacteria bacterium]|nr:hypothetical protein [Gammaproteobacteria bacterium]